MQIKRKCLEFPLAILKKETHANSWGQGAVKYTRSSIFKTELLNIFLNFFSLFSLCETEYKTDDCRHFQLQELLKR